MFFFKRLIGRILSAFGLSQGLWKFLRSVASSLLIGASCWELVAILREFLNRLFGHRTAAAGAAGVPKSTNVMMASHSLPSLPLPYSSPLKDSYGLGNRNTSLSSKPLQWTSLSPAVSAAALRSPASPRNSSPLTAAISPGNNKKKSTTTSCQSNLLSAWNVNLNSFLFDKSTDDKDNNKTSDQYLSSSNSLQSQSQAQAQTSSKKQSRQSVVVTVKAPIIRQELTPEMVSVMFYTMYVHFGTLITFLHAYIVSTIL
jgi:hypothetical protein